VNAAVRAQQLQLLRRCLATGARVAVTYLGADSLAHSRAGRVLAVQGSRFVLASLDPARLPRQATHDLANPEDVLAVEPAR
jgi:hypothetical protein